MKQRYKMIVAVYLIIEDNGKVPFLKRKNTGWRDGEYSLISGHVEYGETLKAGMVREAKEEAGIEVDEDDLELVLVQHRPAYSSPGDERLDFFFKTDKYSGIVTNMEPEKCSSIDRFDINALPDIIIPNTKDGLLKYKTTNYSEFEWEGWTP